MTAVLILTESRDAHANYVEKDLLRKEAKTFRLNTDTFLSEQSGTIFLTVDGDYGAGYVHIGERTVSINRITSVWYRRPQKIVTNIKDSAQLLFAEREFDECLRGLYFALSRAKWVNAIEAISLANNKFRQLHEAQAAGFLFPETRITNDPDAIVSFAKAHPESGLIYKTLFRPCIEGQNGEVIGGIPTTRLSVEHLRQLELIRNSSGIFQQYFEKAYEVRVTIIGSRIFSAKIHSQDYASVVDWRTGVLRGQINVTEYQLPVEMEKKCMLLLKKLGLVFGAIDLIRTPSGEYIFLEINPNGQWYWVEHLTGLPLVNEMATFLAQS